MTISPIAQKVVVALIVAVIVFLVAGLIFAHNIAALCAVLAFLVCLVL